MIIGSLEFLEESNVTMSVKCLSWKQAGEEHSVNLSYYSVIHRRKGPALLAIRYSICALSPRMLVLLDE